MKPLQRAARALVAALAWLSVLPRRLFRMIFPIPRERIVDDSKLERRLAVLNEVPRRCGLCRSFVAQDLGDTMQTNPAFATAARLLGPSIMGALKGAPKGPVGSERARELRPDLSNRWEDYGGCSRWPGLGVWKFDESPSISKEFAGEAAGPCKEWR